MGSSVSKPDFITVLANKQVKSGETIKLSCKSNSEVVTATWKKDGIKLRCVKDKHFIREHGTVFSLEIVNAQESDNGKYTIVLKNKKGEISCSSHVRVELTEWRTFDLNQKKSIDTLKAFEICNKVPELHFLLYGPVGAGKSSTINTIKTIFEGRLFVNCLAAALSEERVLQVVLMTRVDSVCEMTRDNLHNIYKSKKIREKMRDCSDRLGVPVNCIFPIRNYHEETHMKEDINCLMLDVLTHVVYWANKYVNK
ncbi:uncharacterized protein Hap1MRO34_002905 [Clarias gariepinus]